MSRILTIWLPRWPVQRRLLQWPELRRRPVFVCRRERRGMMTVVNWAWVAPPHRPEGPRRQPEAVRIVPGMSLAEAMAVLAMAYGSRACHIAEIDHDDCVADRLALEELARSCRRFAPIVAIEEPPRHRASGPECLHVDVTATAEFFGGEERLVRTVVWTLAARGIHARAAIADTPLAAWAAAHHTAAVPTQPAAGAGRCGGRDLHAPRYRRHAVVPPAEQVRLLADLPAAALDLDAATLSRLREVGVETIGGIARLPRRSLASRFAPELGQRLAHFVGERVEPLVVPRCDELPMAEYAFDTPLLLRDVSVDDVLGVIERLLQACVAPLAAAGKGVMSLQVRFDRSGWLWEKPSVAFSDDGESWKSRGFSRLATAASGSGRPHPRPASCDSALMTDHWEPCPPLVVDVGVFRPCASARHLAELVRLRLARLRLPREITGIAVEVVSAAAAACRQRTLFGEAEQAADVQVGMLLDRLAGRLGRGAVSVPRLVADAQPEHAWVAVPPQVGHGKSRRPQSHPQDAGGAGRHRGLRAAQGPLTVPQRRPIWLLPRPQRLEAVSVMTDPAEVPGPPARFRLSHSSLQASVTHEVVAFAGPERIETAWWRGPMVRRDYYVVETSRGERYWIFRRLTAGGRRDGGWFLHGTFS
jgi:protein ImuB